MSPSGVSSIFLLVVLMYMPDTGNAGVAEICAAKYPVKRCNIESYTWHVLDDSKCIKATEDFLTFDQAEARCKSKGAQLVSVHHLEQYDRLLCYMYRLTNGQKKQFWIGARRGQKGFFWVDGSGGMTFSRWGWFQPDNFFYSEYCVEMNYWEWGRWNDRYCEDKLPSVCAMNVW